MNEIDTTNWGEFKVGELFDIHPTKHYKLTNNYLFNEPGTTPVIVNSSFNNGIGGYVALAPTEKGGIITFSDTTSATAIFYQHSDFIGYSHVQGMYPKSNKWTEKSMLFFLTIFKKVAYSLGFDYVNKFTRDIAKDMTIKLPIDDFNNIDWRYMEEFIEKTIEKNNIHISNVSKISAFKKKKLSIDNWGEFKVEDLFELVKISNKLARKDLNNSGLVPVYSSSTINNGIEGYCENNPDFIITDQTPMYLIFGDHTKAMNIALESFCVMDNVKVLIPKIKDMMIVQFICTVWKKQIPDLGYARHWNKASKVLIKLPVDSNGNLDINYIKNIYGAELNNCQNSYNNLKSIIN